jgi:aspartyl-tRNA synthetase
MSWRERSYCGELTHSGAGKEVLLKGWVDAIRDHGNLLFIHLRDIRGVVQVVFDPRIGMERYEQAMSLREEYIIELRGKVALREQGTENPNLETGNIEVFATDLKVLSGSKLLPFQISEKAMVFGEEIRENPKNVDEELRLQYRYLDLRRPSMQDLLIKRSQIIKCVRDHLYERNFIEIETPFLTKSTPEGARDYLVPSRIHQSRFYALPQSPQLFKQLLMISGFDRYYQIVKCFRDEDLRHNRQPEFTQLDIEASFIDEEFVYELMEELTVRMFETGGITLSQPFPRITYHEAIDTIGSDRPDMRFGLRFIEATDIFKNTRYGIFKHILKCGGHIKGINIKGQSDKLSKNVLQNEYAKQIAPGLGAKGMTWARLINGTLESNIVQFFSKDEQRELIQCFGAENGDVIIMIGDLSYGVVTTVLGLLRTHIAERLGLIPQNIYCPVWITDFPLFDATEEGITSSHHPFTAPDRTEFDPTDRKELLKLCSRAYDLVVNGEELGGGSIRINDIEVQRKVFQALGLSGKEVEKKFGFFLRAFDYGVPPHGGIALGLDRVISMVLGAESIREVIAFPKNRRAYCPLTQAPALVEALQLKELDLKLGSNVECAVSGIKVLRDQDIDGKMTKGIEKISREDVKHVAKLARLRISDPEADAYKKELNAILEHFETLQELDTDKVQPMSHVLEMKNVWRKDGPGSTKETGSLLKNAPMRESGYFKIPKILEGS